MIRKAFVLLGLLLACAPGYCTTIADAKKLPDNSGAALPDRVVTFVGDNYYYIQEDDVPIGIMKTGTSSYLKPGMRVNDYGSGPMRTNGDGERYVSGVTPAVTGSGVIRPVAMPLSALVGGDWNCGPNNAGQKGLPGRSGLNNVGLLVRVYGVYSNVSGYTFTLSDGASNTVQCMMQGELGGNSTGAVVYPACQYASVTGVVSLAAGEPLLRVVSMNPVAPSELVSMPGRPEVVGTAVVGESVLYTTTDAYCSQGHQVQYQFTWGDGSSSAWSTEKSAYHTYTTTGSKQLIVTARCKINPSITQASLPRTVNPAENTNYWERTSGPAGGTPYSFARTSNGHIIAGAGRIYRSVDDGLTWTHLTWSPITSPKVISQWVAVNSKNYIFAGGYQTMFRSLDGGDHWTLSYAGIPGGRNCTATAVAPNDTVFAGFGDAGIYRSTDDGVTWAAASTGIPANTTCQCFAFAGSTVYAGTYGQGIFISTNNGDTWTQSNAGLTTVNVNCMAVGTNGYIYAGTSSGAFRSIDGGSTWTKMSGLYSRIFGLAVDPQGVILATGDYNVYRSTNYGTSWTTLTTPRYYANFRGIAAWSNTILVGTSSATVLRSTTGGNSWTESAAGMRGTRVDAIIGGASGRLIAGGYGLCYTSDDDGATWTPRTVEYLTLPIYSLARDSSNTIFAGTWGDGVYSSTNNGNTWTWVGTDIMGTEIMGLAVNSSDHIYAATYFDGMFKSTNGGVNWTAINAGLTSIYCNAVAVGQNDAVFAATDGGLFRSPDGGANWSRVGSSVVGTYVDNVAAKTDGTVFACQNGYVYRSIDNGDNWALSSTGISRYASVSQLVVDPSGRVFAGGNGYAYVSSNNGVTWTSIDTGLDSHRITDMCVNASGRLFASTYDDGVYRSRAVPAP